MHREAGCIFWSTLFLCLLLNFSRRRQTQALLGEVNTQEVGASTSKKVDASGEEPVTFTSPFENHTEVEDYYELLELKNSVESTEREIKLGFQSLSRRYHPDLNPSQKAKEKYRKIQRAYKVLSDRRTRLMYDIGGVEGVQHLETRDTARGTGERKRSIFLNRFGSESSAQGENIYIDLETPLEELYRGATHELSILKQHVCRRCKGSGACSKNALQICLRCGGEGVLIQTMNLGGLFVHQIQQPCPKCAGKGEIIKEKCPSCHGSRVFKKNDQLEVKIEKGFPDGEHIVLELEGDQHPGQVPEDLMFVIRTMPHPKFRRKGNDLYTSLNITLAESLGGFNRSLTHLDDHKVILCREDLTPPGTVLTILDEGMPRYDRPLEHGKLFVTIHVDFPPKIDISRRIELKGILEALGKG